MEKHPDEEIEATFTHLRDLLTMWERDTGRRNVLIYREQGGMVKRMQDGISVPDDPTITDEQLLTSI